MRLAKYISINILACISCASPGNQDKASDNISVQIVDGVDPDNSSVIYRSTDHGNSWLPFANGIPDDATVGSFLYLDYVTYATTDMHGIYAIKEGENKWLRLDVDLPENVDANAITYMNGSFIIGTDAHGIFTSQDGGYHWIQSHDLNHTPIRCLLSYRDIVFAGTDQGIYKSADDGYSWQHIYKGVQTNGFAVHQDKIYAALMNGAIMTRDEGLNWTYVYQPHTLHDISSDDEHVYAMTLGVGLLKSGNEGESWEPINEGLEHTRFYTFEVKSMDKIIFAGQWHGIYSSIDGGKLWMKMKNGLPDSTAFSTLESTPFGLIAGIGLRKK